MVMWGGKVYCSSCADKMFGTESRLHMQSKSLKKKEEELAEREARINAAVQKQEKEQASVLLARLSSLAENISSLEQDYGALRNHYAGVCDNIIAMVQVVKKELDTAIDKRTNESINLRTSVDTLKDSIKSESVKRVELPVNKEKSDKQDEVSIDPVQTAIDKTAKGIELSLDKIGDGIVYSIDAMVKPFSTLGNKSESITKDRFL
jgi:hypothetical protein